MNKFRPEIKVTPGLNFFYVSNVIEELNVSSRKCEIRLAFTVSGVNFVGVSWLPIGQQCLIVSSATRADSSWLEEVLYTNGIKKLSMQSLPLRHLHPVIKFY
jgi:hypothetical protein